MMNQVYEVKKVAGVFYVANIVDNEVQSAWSDIMDARRACAVMNASYGAWKTEYKKIKQPKAGQPVLKLVK